MKTNEVDLIGQTKVYWDKFQLNAKITIPTCSHALDKTFYDVSRKDGLRNLKNI